MGSELAALIVRLKSPLPVCPFDSRSPDYWTTSNDKPCHVCGGTEAVDKCRGADTRCMDDAATTLSAQEEQIAELRETEARATDDARKLAVKLDEANALIEELSTRLARLSAQEEQIARLLDNVSKVMQALDVPEHKLSDTTFLRGSVMTAKAFARAALQGSKRDG